LIICSHILRSLLSQRNGIMLLISVAIPVGILSPAMAAVRRQDSGAAHPLRRYRRGVRRALPLILATTGRYRCRSDRQDDPTGGPVSTAHRPAYARMDAPARDTATRTLQPSGQRRGFTPMGGAQDSGGSAQLPELMDQGECRDGGPDGGHGEVPPRRVGSLRSVTVPAPNSSTPRGSTTDPALPGRTGGRGVLLRTVTSIQLARFATGSGRSCRLWRCPAER
jgi:hypothetical protein